MAQFYPKKYPDNFWVLLGCVAAYVVLSTAMTGALGVLWGQRRASGSINQSPRVTQMKSADRQHVAPLLCCAAACAVAACGRGKRLGVWQGGRQAR
mgnify:CR=1 FL=1